MDGLDLLLHTQIALGIALVADHADGRFMNQIDVRAKLPSDANRLRISTRIIVKKNLFRI